MLAIIRRHDWQQLDIEIEEIAWYWRLSDDKGKKNMIASDERSQFFRS